MANQKRFEVVKFTLEQSEAVKDCIGKALEDIKEYGITVGNAKEFTILSDALALFTNK